MSCGRKGIFKCTIKKVQQSSCHHHVHSSSGRLFTLSILDVVSSLCPLWLYIVRSCVCIKSIMRGQLYLSSHPLIIKIVKDMGHKTIILTVTFAILMGLKIMTPRRFLIISPCDNKLMYTLTSKIKHLILISQFHIKTLIWFKMIMATFRRECNIHKL